MIELITAIAIWVGWVLIYITIAICVVLAVIACVMLFFSSEVDRWVSWRYLFKKERGRMASLITIISIVGVAVGVATLVSTMSVMDGAQRLYAAKISNLYAHLKIYNSRAAGRGCMSRRSSGSGNTPTCSWPNRCSSRRSC